MSKGLQTSVSRSLREKRIGRILSGKGHRWRVVLIEEGVSANGPYYQKSAVEKIATLAEGQRCYVTEVGEEFDHLKLSLRKPDQQPFRNESAFFENCRVEKIAGRYCATADFVILKDAHWLAERLTDLSRRDMLGDIGFSIVATGICQRVDGRDVVNDIKNLDSTDLVHDPAAGGRILKLVAKRNKNHKPKGSTPMKETLASLLGCFKSLDLFESLRETDLTELSEEEAMDALKATNEEAMGDETTSEQQGLRDILKAMLKMAEGGKIDEMKKFIAGMLSGKYPAPSSGGSEHKDEEEEKLEKIRAILNAESGADLGEAVSKIQKEAKLAEQKLSEKKDEVTQLTERVTALEDEKAKNEAEVFVTDLIENKHILLPKSKDAWVESYLADPERVKAQAIDMCPIAMLERESGHDGEGRNTEVLSVEKANKELAKIMKEQNCDARRAVAILQKRELARKEA